MRPEYKTSTAKMVPRRCDGTAKRLHDAQINKGAALSRVQSLLPYTARRVHARISYRGGQTRIILIVTGMFWPTSQPSLYVCTYCARCIRTALF